MSRLRVGETTQADVDYINTTAIVGEQIATAAPLDADTYCPFVTSLDAVRCDFNRACIDRLEKSDNEVHAWKPKWHHCPENMPKEADLKELYKMPDNKLNWMPLLVKLAVGMPVMHSVNFSRAMRLANGTLARVVGFQFPADDVRKILPENVAGATPLIAPRRMTLHSKLPEIVYVRHMDCDHIFIPELGPGIVPVFPHHIKQSVTMSSRGTERKLDLDYTHIPLVPAYALTVDKLQCQTFKAVIVSDLHFGTSKQQSNGTGAAPKATTINAPSLHFAPLYMALSCVNMCENLHLLEPLTLDYVKSFKIPQSVHEFERILRAIEARNRAELDRQ
jgi:hypothetical protein